jgi:hypothetical protein
MARYPRAVRRGVYEVDLVAGEMARLSAALLDQFGETVKPGRVEILDIDDTFCAAHGGQQRAFWNASHDERGFASMPVQT